MDYDEQDIAFIIANKLNTGDSFKSVGALLKFLGIEDKKGNSHKSIMKMLERYIVINKSEGSNAVTVTKLDVPISSNDRRHNSTISYQREFEILLECLLSDNGTRNKSLNTIYTSKTDLFSAFNCFSSKYPDANKTFSDKRYSYAWNEFNKAVNDICKTYVTDRLKSYSDKDKISYYKVIRAGDKYFDENSITYSRISIIEDEAADELGYEDSWKALNSKKKEEFKKLCLDKIEKEFGFERYSRLIHVSCIDFEASYTAEELKEAKVAYRKMIAEKVTNRIKTHVKNTDEYNDFTRASIEEEPFLEDSELIERYQVQEEAEIYSQESYDMIFGWIKEFIYDSESNEAERF